MKARSLKQQTAFAKTQVLEPEGALRRGAAWPDSLYPRWPDSASGHCFDDPDTCTADEAYRKESLFRHQFLVGTDLCIRLPLEASTLLRAFVTHSHLCGVLHLQIEAFRPQTAVRWCPDSRRMLSLPNAGGSSLVSEVLAFEVLARAFGASLEKTELEISYGRLKDGSGPKMTDFAITLFGGHQLGVSVTRACKWAEGRAPPAGGARRAVGGGLDPLEARRLLTKKLAGINSSSKHVQNTAWRKQLLNVLVFTHRDATLIERTYQQMDAKLRANTVLLLTKCDGVPWVH